MAQYTDSFTGFQGLNADGSVAYSGTLPSLSVGQNAITNAAQSAGIIGPQLPTSSTTSGAVPASSVPASNASTGVAGSAAAPTASPIDASWTFANAIPRISIMVLGIVFVGVGLTMFGKNVGPGEALKTITPRV